MYKYHLSLGSNIEPRLGHLKQAARQLNDLGSILAKSSIFATSPWGFKDQPEFYNAILYLKSRYSPVHLLEKIKEIEYGMGRQSPVRWGPRIIDIDIIWCESIRIHEASLSVPHPRFHERRFVLEPLRELTDALHMNDEIIRVSDLLLNCTDQSTVQKIAAAW